MIYKTLLAASIGLALLSSGLTASHIYAESEVVIIVNPGVGIESLSESDLHNIVLGKKKKWDGGGKIKIAILKSGDTHGNFTKTYAGKTASQFKSYWKKLVFTGEGIQPKSFATEEDLVAYVAKTDGAVGYVSSGTATDGVSTVTID